MKTIVFLILTWVAAAQSPAPGVITVVKQSTVTAVAGGLRCTISTANAGANTNIYCYSGTTLVFNAAVVTLPTPTQPSGPQIGYSYNGDSIVCLFWRSAAGTPVHWQIAANGAMKEDVF